MNIKKQITNVEEFQFITRSELNFEPTKPKQNVIELRQRLMNEELINEYSKASSLILKADGLSDSQYIFIGTIISFGVQNHFLNSEARIKPDQILCNDKTFIVEVASSIFEKVLMYNPEYSEDLERMIHDLHLVQSLIFKLVDLEGLTPIFQEIFDEVHASNMSKRFPDGTIKKREDGKVLKPETYFAPDIESILKKHNYEIY